MPQGRKLVYLAFIAFFSFSESASGWTKAKDTREDPSIYSIGVGIHDATGPVKGVNMMGYANPSQVNTGLHTRLFSRAVIVDDSTRRLVFVSLDAGMISQLVRIEVINRLQEKFGKLYSFQNVILSGTHTHSGPAGYLQYALFQVTSLGFVKQTFEAMVHGIVESIVKAHNSMRKGHIFVAQGDLHDASINRSPTSYEENPEEERKNYDGNTEKQMTLLRFADVNGSDIGMLNWFAVHPTSMNNTNLLVSGDNKGFASQLFEKKMNEGKMPGEGPFVALFAQSNCGDLSPNTKGPHCRDTGLPCEKETSTCGGKSELCIADGPGEDMFESTEIIGRKQFDKAWELFNKKNARKLSGPVQYIQQFVNMSNYTVRLPDGNQTTTCPSAMGYSFAAGTIDGPGAFNFKQGMTEGLPFWSLIVSHIIPPSPEQEKCHKPKPILLNTGNIHLPYDWHPSIMDTAVGIIGQLIIAAVPGEFTTMAGRRLRKKIKQTAESLGLDDAIPVVAGLSNAYSHYITTFEEYQIQRYEGASTIYGPHTLDAYIQQYSYLLQSMAEGTPIPPGPSPPDLRDSVWAAPYGGLPFDVAGIGREFGDVISGPVWPVVATGHTQTAVFVSGDPLNSVVDGGSFAFVERKNEDGEWTVVATDASWETRCIWENSMLGTSHELSVHWDIPEDAKEGTYRLRHVGHYRDMLSDKVHQYSGSTEEFNVSASLTKEKLTSSEETSSSMFTWNYLY